MNTTGPLQIEYREGAPISVEAAIQLYKNSTLGERRPVDRPDIFAGMLKNANLTISAWHEDQLVGIARSLTDFTYVAYLADLAVDSAYQKHGIGKRLVEETQNLLGAECMIVLLAAPKANDYYPKLGFEHNPRLDVEEMTAPILLLGILDDGWAGLSDTARQRLATADVVIGAGRTLELVRPYLSATVTLKDMDGLLGQVPGWISAARDTGQSVVALATGDPLCHGIASWLTGKLGGDGFEILPAVSTLQLAFARFKTPWQDIKISTCHTADAGEWLVGATPAHGLYKLMRTIALHPRVALFTGPDNNPARLARALITAGYGDEVKLSIACRLLLPDEEIFTGMATVDVANRAFPEPNVVLVERTETSTGRSFGLEDLEYIQRSPEKGLITKQEARALSLAKLRIKPDAMVWDIGAGSGSVGLECARLAPQGHVWAIEKNEGDAANARANAERFRIGNYTLCEGKAPAQLDTWPDPDAVFIGGSGGELGELIRLILARLKPGGRLVMNFVTIENLAAATAALKEAEAVWDVVQLQASRSQPILDMHRLAAQNPVWIVTAIKENT